MYAIVDIAGQQFKVEKDQKIYVHHLDASEGSKVEFDKVLLVDNEGTVTVGTPAVDGAKVAARVLAHVKGDKVLVFKKKRRKGYQKMNGHRQHMTQLHILGILEKGQKLQEEAAPKASKPKKAAPKAEVKEEKAPATEAKASETKAPEAKATEAKVPATKATEAKASETKKTEKKAPAKKTAAKKTTAKKATAKKSDTEASAEKKAPAKKTTKKKDTED